MAVVGQTITIVNKSGKVVSTSKHLVNVFNEAKSAYSERRAEIKALRKSENERRVEQVKTLQRLEALDLDAAAADDASSRRSSRRASADRSSTIKRKPVPEPERRSERPPMERGVSDSFYTNDHTSSPRQSRRSSLRPSPLRSEALDPRAGELIRRHTGGLEQTNHSLTAGRRASLDDIDMDLAYGELPPPLPERKYDTEVELRMKMSGLQRLLDECNCLQHSVSAIIDNLQKNPDALAAVALTLAEISNLLTKMAPGALAGMKGAFPAIIALLASPEFAIAAGVGVGVTIIAFGGYKIIKKIKAKKEANLLAFEGAGATALRNEPENADAAGEMDELRELDHIERWRRGIADVEAESVGSTVSGEFVTPQASRTLIQQGRLTEADFKSTVTGSDGKKKRRRKSKSQSEKGSSTRSSSTAKAKEKAKKESSGIRMLFKKS